MTQYEKEHNISFEDILKEQEKFNLITLYEKQLKNLPIGELDVIGCICFFIGFFTFFTMLAVNLDNILNPAVLLFSLLFGGLSFVCSFIVLWVIDSIATDFFNIHLFGFLNKKQIKNLNDIYLKENGSVPDIEKGKHEYYEYLIQKEVRLALINEIDNTLLIAKHYQMVDGNTHIEQLNGLKKQYITFILSDNSEEKFYNLNDRIIILLQIINDSINKQANNQFYTDYIQVDSIKPEQKLKLLDTASKYKEIL